MVLSLAPWRKASISTLRRTESDRVLRICSTRWAGPIFFSNFLIYTPLLRVISFEDYLKKDNLFSLNFTFYFRCLNSHSFFLYKRYRRIINCSNPAGNQKYPGYLKTRWSYFKPRAMKIKPKQMNVTALTIKPAF
jgi:hypothetical protein